MVALIHMRMWLYKNDNRFITQNWKVNMEFVLIYIQRPSIGNIRVQPSVDWFHNGANHQE